MCKRYFLSFLLLNIAASINAVPVMNATDFNMNSTSKETIPNFVNGSNEIAMDNTLPPVELTSVLVPATENETYVRNARSEDESYNITAVYNPDKENSSSAILFPKDEELTPTNTTSPSFNVSASNSSELVEEIANVSITEGIIETSSSSSSSTNTDLSSTTQKPLAAVNGTGIISSLTSSNSSIADSEIRVGRSQPDEIEDEITGNLTQTLVALTTLSSIINQTSVNDSYSTVV